MAYKGQVAQLPIGFDGLTGLKTMTQVRPTQLIEARNITYEAGTIRKEGGAAAYNATAITGTPKVLGGWDWWTTPGANQRMIVVTDDGKILKDSGTAAFPTTLKSGLTFDTTTVPVFVEGGVEAAGNARKLFIFTEQNAVQVLNADGATAANLATPPADWTGTTQPITGCIHEGRLWGMMGHIAYYSMTTNHESFTGAGSGQIVVYPGEGEKIIASTAYRGALILWKFPAGIYFIDTTDPALANWKVKKFSDEVGLSSPLAYAILDNDIIFMDASGNVQLMSAAIEFGSFLSRNLSQLAYLGPFIRDTTNQGQYKQIRSLYYPEKREAHFAVASAGSAFNNSRIVVDLNRLDVPRFRFSDFPTCVSLWLRKDTNLILRPIAGDNGGKVWQMDQATRSNNALGYNGKFQIPHLDLSENVPTDLFFYAIKLAKMRKAGQFLELVVEPKGNWNLNVDIVWDGVIKQTVTFNMGETGAALDSFVLGTDVLAGESVLNKKRRIVGSGRRFSLIGSNNGAAQDFSIAKMILHFVPTDERR